MELWITHGTLMTQDDSRRAVKGHLRIIGNRITEIRTSLPKRLPRGAKVLNASGLTVLPGFVQTHTHLCQTLFRNAADDLELMDWLSQKIWPMEAAHTPSTLEAAALCGIHELLASGTTTILDMATVRHTETILKTVLKTGIRANVGKCLMDRNEFSPPDLCEGTERALAEANQIHKKWNGKANDRIRVSFAPRFALSCTDRLLREVGRLAKEKNMLIHTHASENRKEVEMVRKLTRQDNIAYFKSMGLVQSGLVLAHGIWLSDQEMDILAKADATVTHCPSSNLKLASGIAKVPELIKKGINVSLGADGAPCNNGLNMFNEMRLAALIQKPTHGPRAMQALEVLDMATRNGARALQWAEDIGSIEEGKKADLVFLDLEQVENAVFQPLNPEAIASSIVYSTQPSHVRMTMVDGKLVYHRGKVKAIPYAPLLRRMRSAQKMLHQKIKSR